MMASFLQQQVLNDFIQGKSPKELRHFRNGTTASQNGSDGTAK
jgi:hypothetical protein